MASRAAPDPMATATAGDDTTPFRVFSAALLHTYVVTEPVRPARAPDSGELYPSAISPGGRPRSARRVLGVEANARLTAIAGLVLLVMLAAEGLTILSIRSLISWHAAIGLALIPVVGVKLGSTLWRFGRYYWGDLRYRAAGPPHPIMRLLGPVIVVTTAIVLATGIAAWVAGPHNGPWLSLHKASFVVWFGAMAIHVLAYTRRALRLARDDVHRPRRTMVPYRPLRLGLVAASICAGVALGLAASGIGSGWTDFVHRFH